jgi:hypothetical protein
MGNSFELPPQLTSTPKNARRAGRVRCQWTHCNLGEVLDISSTGMRVLCKRRPAADVGSVLAAVIDGLDGPVDVAGKVIWKKKVGFFRWQIGVEFGDLLPASRKGLALLARASLANDTIAVQDHARKSA